MEQSLLFQFVCYAFNVMLIITFVVKYVFHRWQEARPCRISEPSNESGDVLSDSLRASTAHQQALKGARQLIVDAVEHLQVSCRVPVCL